MSETSKQPIIKVKNMNVVYLVGKDNEVRALQNINLEIFPGEFIIFFGPSGCGKSTLLYSVAGLERNAHGEILVGGEDITKMNQKQFEKFHQTKIGMVFQAYYLIPSLSVLKNVMLPQITLGIPPEKRKQRTLELLEYFGVKSQANKLPTDLSGGQQQRVAICRALVNDPEILFADEPVGNLDSKSAADVMNLFRELNEKFKKTIVLVTHDPTHLKIADRVFFLKDGQLEKVEVNEKNDKKTSASLEIETNAGIPGGGDANLQLPKELGLLVRSFKSMSGMVGGLMLPFIAKQIAVESLLDMTGDELDNITKKTESLMMSNLPDNKTVFKYFDDPVEEGGLGMDKRKAAVLAERIDDLIKEIKTLIALDRERAAGKTTAEAEAEQIRYYLCRSFNLKIKNEIAAKTMNSAITDRLLNKIDHDGFQKKLDLPPKEGGVGLDKREVIKLARRMELLMLGKYNK